MKKIFGVIQFSGAVAMYILWEFHKIEIRIYCCWKEISVELYEERWDFKVNIRFYGLLNEITVELWLPWLFVNVADHP